MLGKRGGSRVNVGSGVGVGGGRMHGHLPVALVFREVWMPRCHSALLVISYFIHMLIRRLSR